MVSVDCLIVTAVWGAWHTDAFLTLNLPTLFADGNLPALAARHRLRYRIVTRQADRARLEVAPAIQRLRSLMPVTVEVVPDRLLADPIAAHVAIWRQSISDAATDGAFVLLMPPDVLWSDGSYDHVATLLSAGKQAIFLAFPRVSTNSFEPDFKARYGPAPDRVTLDARELVAWTIRHLHPLTAAYARDSRHFPSHAEMILWPVPGEGMAVRALAREPLLFNPTRFSISSLQMLEGVESEAELALPSDSDQIFGISLAPLGKDASWHVALARLEASGLGRWWLQYDAPANDYVSSTRLRWHHTPASEAMWRRVECLGDRLVRSAALAREGWRILEALSEHPGAAMARRLLWIWLETGQLARALRGLPQRPAGTVVVTVPVGAGGEAALDRVDGGRPGTSGRLIRQLVSVADRPLTVADLEGGGVTVDGLDGETRRLGAGRLGDLALESVSFLSKSLLLCYTPQLPAAASGAAGLRARPRLRSRQCEIQ